jgi:hypothetical protein
MKLLVVVGTGMAAAGGAVAGAGAPEAPGFDWRGALSQVVRTVAMFSFMQMVIKTVTNPPAKAPVMRPTTGGSDSLAAGG